jgi:hypothetical protein
MTESRPPLDPGVLEVIRRSAAGLSQMPDVFADGLQADIATLAPDLAPGGRAFCERMVHALLWAALTDDPPPAVAASLRWVGTMNYLDGFPEAQYVNIAHALVRVVHDLAGSHWSTSMGSAWISYFLWIRPYLEDGARQAAARQAAQQPVRPSTPVPAPGDADLESVAGLPGDDGDDQDPGYGQVMISMTRPSHRGKHSH